MLQKTKRPRINKPVKVKFNFMKKGAKNLKRIEVGVFRESFGGSLKDQYILNR